MRNTTAQTILQVFQKTAEAHGALPALKYKRDGVWQSLTWKEYYHRTRQVARGFMKLGLEPGKGVAILGFNRPEWFLSDLGAIFAGGIPAGIYTTSSPEQCQYVADHCEAQVVVLENAEYLARFRQVRDRLPHLKAIVLMEGSDPAEGVHSWEELLEVGKETPEEELQKRMDAQKPEELCTLIYTSGTTGPPKAVMISHANFTWTAAAIIDMVRCRIGENFLSYLPLSHVAEQIVSLHGPMPIAGCVWFAESLERLRDNLKECRPHIFLGVPRVWEKIQAGILEKGARNPPLKRKIAAWARKVGLEAAYARERGESPSFWNGLAEKLVFSKVREALGLDRCRYQCTSAAPISRSTLEFFFSLGIPVYEIYGMSECTGPATVSLPGAYRIGKCGRPMPGTEVKIAEDGEVCIRGPHVFMGYYKDPEATREALDDEGWLHSGDIGDIDADGFLRITDRKKDLLITAGGENVAPQVIEGMLQSIPVVSRAVVVGDRRKYLAALLTLDPGRVAAEAQAAGSAARTAEEAGKCEKFRDRLEKQVQQVNARLARVQMVKRWKILPRDFTIEGGELTPTMKVRRKVVYQKYAREIEDLYAEEAVPAG